GAICARLFPAVVRQNWLAAQHNRCTAEIKMKMQEAAHLLTGQADADGLLLAEFLNQFIDSLDIPRLRDWGLEPQHFDLIATQSASASSMKSNPVTLEQSELLAILAEAH
ncbi:MAG: iron-containing alcohol dehydrogenase, partial [Anaerolineae bacterium]|nr:iron-containing alcohol dehydrogenase [Anaerolineae bacterium]